jgi:hypothetical protein
MTELTTIARRINDREQAIAMLKNQTLDKATEALRELLLQGADLMQAKAALRHGQWQSWLLLHCPTISERTARLYMQLASNRQRVADLVSARSIRLALAMLDEPDEAGEDKQPKRWPPYLEAAGRLSKLVGYVERFPFIAWPSEGLEKFREDLQPIAAKLWPEKFTTSQP